MKVTKEKAPIGLALIGAKLHLLYQSAECLARKLRADSVGSSLEGATPKLRLKGQTVGKVQL